MGRDLLDNLSKNKPTRITSNQMTLKKKSFAPFHLMRKIIPAVFFLWARRLIENAQFRLVIRSYLAEKIMKRGSVNIG